MEPSIIQVLHFSSTFEYEEFLEENDQDLYKWLSGQATGGVRYEALIDQIQVYLRSRY